jgi:hypothetical protein
MKIHHTRSLYPNGDFHDNGVPDFRLKSHVEYNMLWRPGRALFVDGKCVYEGINVRPEAIAAMEAQLAERPVVMRRDTAPYH